MATYSTFDSLIPEVRQYCNQAPSILVRTHLIKSCIRFLERSLILKKQPSSFCLDEDEHTYTLKYSSDRYRAIALKEVLFSDPDDLQNGKLIRVTAEESLDNTVRRWRNREGNTPTTCFLTDDLNTIRFYPMPNTDSDNEMFIDSVVTLKRDQTEVDSFIVEKWEEVIQNGAISTLFAIPNAAWGDSGLAADFGRAFKRGVRNARATSLRGTGEEPGQVVPQSFISPGSSNIYGQSRSWGDI